jgi:hypothetical protein
MQVKNSGSSNNFENVRSIKAKENFNKIQEHMNIRKADAWGFTIRLSGVYNLQVAPQTGHHQIRIAEAQPPRWLYLSTVSNTNH